MTLITGKSKPTFEEYEEMGMMLKDLEDRLSQYGCYISNHVGKTFMRRCFDYIGITRKLNTLQSELEEKMYKEYPGQSNLDVFYGVENRDYAKWKEGKK